MKIPSVAAVDSDIPVSDSVCPTVLTYHKVGRVSEFGITTVSVRQFAVHLDSMLDIGKKVVPASEAVTSRDGAEIVALTFDDGYRSLYTHAFPEIESRGIRGTVFPVVGHIGGYNTWDVRLSPRRVRHLFWPDIRELATYGFEVGSHTLSHRDLTRLEKKVLRKELRLSKRILEDRVGVVVRSISYPFGRFSQRVVDEALEAGYEFGYLSYPRRVLNTMAIGRMTVHAIDGRRAVLRKVKEMRGYRFECLKNSLVAALSLGTTLVKR